MTTAYIDTLVMASDSTANRIRSFEKLPQGWHYGEGCPPQREIIDAALELNNKARDSGFLETDAFPGIDGEIRVTVYQGPDYLEFTVESNGTITFVHESEDQELTCEEGLALEETKEKIEAFAEHLWGSSDLSTESISTESSGGFKVWLSETPVQGEEEVYLLFNRSASPKREQRSARMSNATITRISMNPTSTGISRRPPSLVNVSSTRRVRQVAMSATTT